MTQPHKPSRRTFVRTALWSAAGAAVAAGGGYAVLTLRGRQGEGEIRFTAPTSYDLTANDWAQMTRDIGLSIRFADNGNDVGPVLARMLTGTMANDFDVQGLQGGSETELARAGAILPWDLSKIPNWERVWGWAKELPYAIVKGQQYGIPIALNADSIIYLPGAIRRIPGYGAGVVDSYAAIFDSRLAGRTSMEDAWINSAIFTAIYLKAQGVAIKDPGNLTVSELKEVMTFLINKKRAGQFRRFWQGWEQGVQLLRSGEVIAMTGWEPIVKALQREGINAKYAVPKEGYEGWTNTLLLHAGAKTRDRVDRAHRFANWLLDGYYGCALISLRGYVVPSDRTLVYAKGSKQFDVTAIEAGVDNVRQKLQNSAVYWQNVRPNEYRAYEEWWDKLRNA